VEAQQRLDLPAQRPVVAAGSIQRRETLVLGQFANLEKEALDAAVGNGICALPDLSRARHSVIPAPVSPAAKPPAVAPISDTAV
jgi:hypothetical protein